MVTMRVVLVKEKLIHLKGVMGHLDHPTGAALVAEQNLAIAVVTAILVAQVVAQVVADVLLVAQQLVVVVVILDVMVLVIISVKADVTKSVHQTVHLGALNPVLAAAAIAVQL